MRLENNILNVPLVVTIKQTNQIDLRVCKNINQSVPESEIRGQGNQSFVTCCHRFTARSLFCKEKFQEKPLGPG